MMEYKGYLAQVDYDDETGAFHGEVVNLRDVITFEGDCVAELKQAFRDSVEDYLAFCAARGEEWVSRALEDAARVPARG